MNTLFLPFRYLALLFLSVTCIHISGQPVFEDKQKETIIANKIKSITSWDYNFHDDKPEKNGQKTSFNKYDEKGNIIESVTYKLKDTLAHETYKYDKQGNRIDYTKKRGVKVAYQKVSKFDEKSNLVQESGFDGTTKFKNDYEYYENGKLNHITYTSDNLIIEKRVFEHDGNLTNISVYNSAGAVKSYLSLKYNDAGNIIEEITYDLSKKPLDRKVYVYNSNYKVISEVKYRGDVFYYKLTYLYNNKNDLTSIDEENPNESRFQKKQFSYDSKGNLLEMKWRRNSKEEFSTRTYAYDTSNNCTQYITYYPATKFRVLTKFTYE
jgi:hypothetical protein